MAGWIKKSTVAVVPSAFLFSQIADQLTPLQHLFAHRGPLYLPREQPYFYRHQAV